MAATQPAKIGDELEVDVILSREPSFDSEVTEYPVEDGFPVADHVTRTPMRLSMTVICTPSPVTWYDALGPNPNRINDVANAIQAIYKAGDPITVTVPDAIYTEMVMTHAPIPRTIEDGVCTKMQLDFVHVRRVTPKEEDVPEGTTGDEAAGMAGESGKDAGAANQQEIGTGMETVDSSPAVNANTKMADKTTAGQINSGRELTAQAAATAIAGALAPKIRG